MALVTGASGGIAKAFAETLPSSTDLLLVARSEERLERLRRDLAPPDRKVVARAADLTTDAGRDRGIEQGRALEIDLLINYAGRGRVGRLIDHALEDGRAERGHAAGHDPRAAAGHAGGSAGDGPA